MTRLVDRVLTPKVFTLMLAINSFSCGANLMNGFWPLAIVCGICAFWMFDGLFRLLTDQTERRWIKDGP